MNKILLGVVVLLIMAAVIFAAVQGSGEDTVATPQSTPTPLLDAPIQTTSASPTATAVTE